MTHPQLAKEARELRYRIHRGMLTVARILQDSADLYEARAIGTPELAMTFNELTLTANALREQVARLELTERFAKEG